MTVPKEDLRAAALAAHAEGLCVIPAKADGTKAPIGRWKQWQFERPSENMLLTWFGPHTGMGIVCGKVSGRLECLEIEGAFADRYGEVRERLGMAGLLEEWDRWIEGYAERTPSGGIHVLVRIEGEGPLPGNTKIALGPESECWIETRGEGGFVIVAPSGGETHPSGKPWQLRSGGFDSIAVTTIDLWDAIVNLLSSFDESPAVADPPPLLAQRDQHNGEGWIGEALAAYPSLTEVLQHHGWQYVRSEPLGQLWRRPGKDIGHSARINESGRLVNFSSSTPLPLGKRTFDALDVDLAYELGHVPTLEERTARLRELRPTVSAAGEAPADDARLLSLNLPDGFWTRRSYLATVYLAALHGRVSPDALWMATKVNYAGTIPFNFRLPLDGTLDYIGVMVGPSGSGKSLSKHMAIELLGPDFANLPRIRLGLPPGTGEGMTEAYIKRDKDGEQSFRYRGLSFYIDEGTWLFDVGARSGNTTIQAVKNAWSGELTGSLAATAERNRVLPPRSVRFALLIGIQPGVASKFMRADLTDGGLPQRICWCWAQHPHWPEIAPEHPGLLDVPLYERGEHEAIIVIDYEPAIQRLLDESRRAATTGVGSSPLEGHAGLAIAKAAAIHALMNGRTKINEDDWDLASIEWSVSEKIRSHILAVEQASASDTAVARGTASAYEKIAEHNVFLGQAAISIARRAQKAGEPMLARDLTDAVTGKQKRMGVSKRDALQHALSLGYIVKVGDLYRAGRVRP